MKRIKKLFLTSLFLLLLSLNITKCEKSVANPIPLIRYTGGILPKDNYSLSLISADVKIDADTSNLNYLKGVSFKANYTIFNPDDEVNVTIGAPFQFYPSNNCTVSVNGTLIPFEILEEGEIQSEIWYEYLITCYDRHYFSIYWISCNITIPKNTSIEIQYEFKKPKPTYSSTPAYFDIIYDVGTARLWHGNITEIVEIRVHGHLPSSIYNEHLCNITDISDGVCYIWEWIDERIDVDFVGLCYDFDNQNQLLFEIIFIILISIPIIGGIGLIIAIIYYKKKNWWERYLDSES